MMNAKNKNLLAATLLFVVTSLFFLFRASNLLAPNTNSAIYKESKDNTTVANDMGEVVSIQDELKFAFGGDMMFDRNVDYHFRDDKILQIFDNLKPNPFYGMDLSMANLEGPISPAPIPADNTKDNLIFNFPPTVPSVLSALSVNAVSLANNHTLNNGQTGLENTKKVLLENNILSLGEERRFGDFSIGHFGSGSAKIAVIAINILETSTDLSPVIKQEVANGYRPVIFPHWGIEYDKVHSSTQEKLAYAWIDSGALMVVGSHPHVVQDVEVYHDRPIVYSLGNFLFDQNFSSETQSGLVISGTMTKDNLTLSFLPTKIVNFQPELLTGSEKISYLANIQKQIPNWLNVESNTIKISL